MTSSLDRDRLAFQLLYRIRQSCTLQDILQVTATEVQAFLSIDRIKIYQFHPDGSGLVIAEALAPNATLPSLVGLNFPADDIPEVTRQLFIEARVRTVVNVESGQIGESRLRDPKTGEMRSGDLHYRPLDPCHAEYLTTMGVQSTVVVPILHEDKLWGLLVGHHATPRELTLDQLYGLQFMVEQLSLAIDQSILLTQAQERAAREATINRIHHWLNELPTIELQSALAETIQAIGGVGGRLFMREDALESGQLYTWGQQPVMNERANPQQIELCHAWKEHFHSGGYQPWMTSEFDPTQVQPWIIEDVYRVSELRNLQSAFRTSKIRSLLVIPLQSHQQIMGYLSIFRSEIEIETAWAGEFDPDSRQEFPRQSFEIWRQLKTEQVQPWTDAEVEWAMKIGKSFATAIEKTLLQQRIQAFNLTLEQQVKDRTQALQTTLDTLHKTQAHLIQAEKMSSLAQLVAGVAHEINNPVTFIHGNLVHLHDYFQDLLNLIHLYQCDPLPVAEIREVLETIDFEFIADDLPKTLASLRFGTERIREIVLLLRNFSRLDQSDLKTVNLHEGLDNTLMLLQHRFVLPGNRMKIEILKDYGDLPDVECYASLMNQVFLNLFNNAIEAIEQLSAQSDRVPESWQPEIYVSTHLLPAYGMEDQTEIPDRIQINILDNGIGMTDETRQKIFDPFFTTKPVGQGTGLGLSISYQIITEQHHGQIICDSNPAGGTKFQVEIPLSRSAT